MTGGLRARNVRAVIIFVLWRARPSDDGEVVQRYMYISPKHGKSCNVSQHKNFGNVASSCKSHDTHPYQPNAAEREWCTRVSSS